jgi:hypothetical protein
MPQIDPDKNPKQVQIDPGDEYSNMILNVYSQSYVGEMFVLKSGVKVMQIVYSTRI